MPFGRKAAPTRAYAYHAVLVDGQDAIRAELRRRTLLWNALAELDHELRERKAEIADDFLGVPEDDREDRRQQVAALRARREHAEADAIERAAWRARKPAWQDDGVKAALAALERECYERAKAAMYAVLDGERCCWWPNSNAVRASFDQGRRKPDPLRFHRAADEDKLDIQLIGGRPVDELVSGAWAARGFVQMESWDPAARQKHTVTPLRLRVGTDAERRPVWTTWRVCFHRPLPAGGKVQQVQIVRRTIANQTYWTIIFLVALPDIAEVADIADVAEVAEVPGRTIWLDLGWRWLPDTTDAWPADGSLPPGHLRVTTWRDDAGATGDLCLPSDWLAQRAKVDELRGLRDQLFDEARASLGAWLAQHDAPAWLREECRALHQWRSPGRLAALLGRWRQQRFPDDATIFPGLAERRDPATGRRDDWLARDRHLWQWERHLHDRLIGRRREAYRRFAAGLARRYGRVVMEEIDWRQLARRPRRDSPAPDRQTQWQWEREAAARRHRTWAAVSLLELAIDNAVKREGGQVKRASSPGTTAICSNCSSCERWDHAERVHTCSQCGETWDQDQNTVALLALREAPATR